MAVEVLTTEDLTKFKVELLHEFKNLLKESSGAHTKKWLRSAEVQKLLRISRGTLQNLRNNGTLPYAKIGGVMYYSTRDIQRLLENSDFYLAKKK